MDKSFSATISIAKCSYEAIRLTIISKEEAAVEPASRQKKYEILLEIIENNTRTEIVDKNGKKATKLTQHLRDSNYYEYYCSTNNHDRYFNTRTGSDTIINLNKHQQS